MAHHPFDDPKADELPEKTMNIAVIIPSALRTRPDTDELWLARALRSVQAQTLQPKEVVVGVDPGVTPPLNSLLPFMPNNRLLFAAGHIKGHQAACNAAAKMATAPLLAFLEDDDEWEPDHLERMAKAADDCPYYFVYYFVTASQQTVNLRGDKISEFHFATMSSWVITRLAWARMGGVDERWKIHHDNEFLARYTRSFGAHGRVHLVPEGAYLDHPWLKNIAQSGVAVKPVLPAMTVKRTIHDESILAGCQRNEERAIRSNMEYAALKVLYGTMGW